MFKLRDYQQEAVNSTLRYFIKHGEKSGNPVILLPTGTGKSLVIAGLLKTIHDNWGSTRMIRYASQGKFLSRKRIDRPEPR